MEDNTEKTWEINYKLEKQETLARMDSKAEAVKTYLILKSKFNFSFIKIYCNCEDVTNEIDEFLKG